MRSSWLPLLWAQMIIIVTIVHHSLSQTGTKSDRCVDSETANCADPPDVCNDISHAQQFCPKHCGMCVDFQAECSVPENTVCSSMPGVCDDLQLAVIICPFTCGFCTANATTTITTAMPTNTDGFSQCPTCSDALHTDDCKLHLQTCPKNHVCQGTIKDWKLSMECKSPLICNFAEYQGNRNCTSGHAFGPHEECTFCCQGDECDEDLTKVQEGLDTIPLVLHCPTCTNVTYPRQCAQRVVPCEEGFNTCKVVNRHGHYTANCDKVHACRSHATGLKCDVDVNGKCTYCCHGSHCLNVAFGLGADNSDVTTSTPGICQDADYYPCDFAKHVACNDLDMSLTVCPVTCDKCDQLQN